MNREEPLLVWKSQTVLPESHPTKVSKITLYTEQPIPTQDRRGSAEEWIRKLCYIYTMEYYSAIKKSTFESVLIGWMKLEPIIQSEVSQKEKHQYSILMHIYMEFGKMVTITLYARQKKRQRCIEQTFGLCGRRQGWDDLRE